MKNDRAWLSEGITGHSYRRIETDRFIVTYRGIITTLDNQSSETDCVNRVAEQFASNKLNFDSLIGFYTIVIEYKETSEVVFWGDNSGSQRFYIDNERKTFSDSLLALRKMRGKDIEPDYASILQLLCTDRIVTGRTVIDGIVPTDPRFYYSVKGDVITPNSKKLSSLKDLGTSADLNRIITALTRAVHDEKVCAVITGGTDSRVILAHLYASGIRPQLMITGHKNNPDVPIARQIADMLRLPLKVFDTDYTDDCDWIQEGFVFGDGVYDVVASYRHAMKARWVQENGFAYEFGGTGGEFYKNNYYRPFRKLMLFRKATDQRIYDALLNYKTRDMLGNRCREAVPALNQSLMQLVHEYREEGTLRFCNSVGSRLLFDKAYPVGNSYAKYCTKIDPLLERHVIASVCRQNPIRLSMAVWQRKQIALQCPELSDIPTDQGYTTTLRRGRLFLERVRKLKQYAVLTKKYFFRSITGKQKDGYWDAEYILTKKSAYFRDAMKTCKALDIINQSTTIEQVPKATVGFILMIGMLFSERFNDYMKYQPDRIDE